MSGRTPAEAVNRHLELLQPIVTCVTDGVLNVSGGYFPRDEPHKLTLGDNLPTSLSGSSDLALSIIQYYRIIEAIGADGPWMFSIVGYQYIVSHRSEGLILAYHWHPHGQSTTTWPHFHIESGAQLGFRPLSRAHLPTGDITLGAIVRMLIQDFDVEPRRDDWREIVNVV